MKAFRFRKPAGRRNLARVLDSLAAIATIVHYSLEIIARLIAFLS